MDKDLSRRSRRTTNPTDFHASVGAGMPEYEYNMARLGHHAEVNGTKVAGRPTERELDLEEGGHATGDGGVKVTTAVYQKEESLSGFPEEVSRDML